MTSNQHASLNPSLQSDTVVTPIKAVGAVAVVSVEAIVAESQGLACVEEAADANKPTVVSASSAVGINDVADVPDNELSEPLLESPVHQGHDGWLFLVSGSNKVLNLYKHESSFTNAMADSWVELLQTRNSRLHEMGIQYLHLPAPEKLTVLPEHYNGTLENIEGSPLLHMAAKHAAKVPCMVNVVPFFRKQPAETKLYWKTDTHWSFWGCFSAYQLLCARMGVEPLSAILNYPYDEGDCMFDLGAKMPEPRKELARFYKLAQKATRTYANPIMRFKEGQKLVDAGHLHVGSHVVYKNPSADAVDKCVMLFGDSFSECREHLLTGMLAETFREVHFIWNPSIDYEYVEFVQPDIVITELAERFMTRIPEDNLIIQTFAAWRLADYNSKAIHEEPKHS